MTVSVLVVDDSGFFRKRLTEILTDEWRADYDFTAALQNLDLLYRLGLTVADSESWPAWKPTAEFNAIRDRTADQRR